MIDVSTIVKNQFPDYMKAEAPNLIAFVQAYYEWVEQSDLIYGRDLTDLRDIDNTIDSFLAYFKTKYLHGLPTLTRGDLRQFIKRSKDLYEAKGTEKSIQLLLRLLYDVDSSVYTPGNDVLRASAGQWYRPVYLEVSPISTNVNFVNKQIIGSSSGARAIVERVVRRIIKGVYCDVLYLSSVTGNFETNERITADGDLQNSPTVTGSLNRIQIVNGGKDNSVGDVFDIFSVKGKQGRARVISAEDGTGRVEFSLIEGGTGYTIDANTIVSNTMFIVENVTGTGFERFESVEQRLNSLQLISGNGVYTVGSTVKGYTSGTWIEQGAGIIKIVDGNTSIANVVIEVTTGDFRAADVLRLAGNTVGSLIDTSSNVTAVANVVGSNSTHLGVIVTQNTFRQPAFIRGRVSETTANVVGLGTGSGATFSVASIENEESVFLNTDFWSGVNSANVPYLSIAVNGSGSGIGFVDSVTVTSAGSGYANGGAVTFSGGSREVASITINSAGSGYANGQHVTTSTPTISGNTLITLTTNGAGAITAFNIIESGMFSVRPTLVVANTSGVGANLTAVMGNASTPATGTVTTNGSGNIVSVSVTGQGAGYFSAPLLTAAGGTGAVLTPVMDYGYGLPKNTHSDLGSVINDTLVFDTISAGSISSLNGISPGSQYNMDPFVAVTEAMVVGLDRRDFELTLTGTQGAFVIGEQVQQDIVSPTVQLTIGAITGNSAFALNEVVTQTGGVSGVIYYRDPTTLRLKEVIGTFANNVVVTGSFSHANTTPTAVTNITQLATAKGSIRSANSTNMIVRRTSINTSFKVGSPIRGRKSNANSTIVSYLTNNEHEAMGNNAIVAANVKTANGIAIAVEVFDSGYGYAPDEELTLVNPDNIYTITGRSVLENQGTGEGYWRSTAGFLNNDQHLHDGSYYQAFSYEIQTELALDRYAEVLKKIAHVAGTEMFGKVVMQPTALFDMEVAATITQA